MLYQIEIISNPALYTVAIASFLNLVLQNFNILHTGAKAGAAGIQRDAQIAGPELPGRKIVSPVKW
jgi:hypothetical protein